MAEATDWRAFLRAEEDGAMLERLRRHGRPGRPPGEVSFLRRPERRLDRRLVPVAPGRPRKGEKE